MKTILEVQRQTDVLHEAEVIVVGGGPAGISAALSSARMGAQTILLDRFGSLGGLQAYGNSPTFSFVDPELHGGIIQEILGRLKEDGALKNIDDVPGPRSHLKAGVIAAVGADKLPKRFVETDVGTWGNWAQPFDSQYYKFLLDQIVYSV